MPQHAMACQCMPWRGMNWHAMACRGMLWHVMACHGMPWHALACHGMPRQAMPCREKYPGDCHDKVAMSRDVATWVPRHRQRPLRDMAAWGNHVARCRWRCAGLALATSPWLRITSRDVAGDVWRSSLRSPLGPGPGPWALGLGPGTRAPFFNHSSVGGLWSILGATLVIGCYSCHWALVL